ETVSQRAGVLNVGIEGMMLVGAFTGVLGAVMLASPWLGLVVAMAAGTAMAAFHALLCLRLRLDQIVAGIAMTLLGLGLSGFGNPITLGAEKTVSAPSFARLDFGALSDLPVLGPALFQHHALVYISVAFAFVLWWFVARTGWGLAIRAVGEDPI